MKHIVTVLLAMIQLNAMDLSKENFIEDLKLDQFFGLRSFADSSDLKVISIRFKKGDIQKKHLQRSKIITQGIYCTSIENTIWWHSEMAAETAYVKDLPKDVRHFFIRQDGVGTQQPYWAKGVKPWKSFGPFVKPSGVGGNVPAGKKVYIDIYKGIK